MKALAWYSAIIVTFSSVSLGIGVMSGQSLDVATDLWAIALYVPVLVFAILWLVREHRGY